MFVNLPHIQSEGIDAVLDALAEAGTQALCLTPKVARQASAADGVRLPPLHRDGHRRVFARPIWGRRDLHVTYVNPLDAPNDARAADATLASMALPDLVVQRAHERGLRVYMLLQPLAFASTLPGAKPVSLASPPRHERSISNACCPNNPEARRQGLDLVARAVTRYADLDGLILDWAEYDIYDLEGHFTCFCEHCEARAHGEGVDWGSIRIGASECIDSLHRVTAGGLVDLAEKLGSPADPAGGSSASHWLFELAHLKSRSIVDFVRDIRRTMKAGGASRMHLIVRGWPPPWHHSSGTAYDSLTSICDALAPKLFLFDYAAIPGWYAQTLLAWNPALKEEAVLDAVVNCFEIPDVRNVRRLDDYHIPAPDERHPVPLGTYLRKLDEVATMCGTRSVVTPFIHAYLPDEQWDELLSGLRRRAFDGIWVQSYGYLSDAKLRILRDTWSA